MLSTLVGKIFLFWRMSNQETKTVSKLAEYRKSKGYSQDQLAKIVGVTTATIQNWENDRGMGSVMRILKLCRELDADVRELFPVEN